MKCSLRTTTNYGASAKRARIRASWDAPAKQDFRTTASLLASSRAAKTIVIGSLSEGTKFAELVLMPMYFFRVATSKRAILGPRIDRSICLPDPARPHSRSTSIRVPSLEPARDRMPALA